MPDNKTNYMKTNYSFRFLASTSIIALSLATVPVAMDFEFDEPLLKLAQAKDGGEGGGDEGGEGDNSGHGGDEGGHGDNSGHGGDESGPDDEDGDDENGDSILPSQQ